VVVGDVSLVVRSDIVVVEDSRVVLDVVGSKVVVVVSCFMVDDGANVVVGVNVLADVDVFVIGVGEAYTDPTKHTVVDPDAREG
jgi:hypothetical protein